MPRDFQSYWERSCTSNPSLRDSVSVTLKIESLRALVEKAYNNGSDDRAAMEAALRKLRETFGAGGIFNRK